MITVIVLARISAMILK